MITIASVTQVSVASQHEAFTAGIAATIWLVIIGLMHFIKPNLKPSTRLVSEYAIKPKGWPMRLAFFCMAIACFTLTMAAWSYVAHVGLILLALVGLGFTGAGIFVTDPVFIGEGGQTGSGKLHVLFAFVTILLFPIMATLVDVSTGKSSVWSSIHAWLPVLSILTWLGFVSFLATSIYHAIHENALVGYAERFLILAYTIWLVVIAFAMV